MIRQRRLGTLGLGIIGLILMLLGTRSDNGGQAAVSRQVNVVVTTRSITAGMPMGPGDVTIEQVNDSEALASMAHDKNAVLGRSLLTSLPPNAPIILAVLTSSDNSDNGLRLVNLVVNTQNMDPSINKGDQVEVIAALDSGDNGGKKVVRSIAQGHVLAVTSTTAPASNANAVSSLPNSNDSSRLVTLQTNQQTVTDIIWVQNYAHSVTLIRRPSSNTQPLPSSQGKF